VLLRFHGNGEIVGDYDDFFAPELLAAGLDAHTDEIVEAVARFAKRVTGA